MQVVKLAWLLGMALFMGCGSRATPPVPDLIENSLEFDQASQQDGAGPSPVALPSDAWTVIDAGLLRPHADGSVHVTVNLDGQTDRAMTKGARGPFFYPLM